MLATHEPSSPTNNHIQHQIKEHVSNDSISCKKKKEKIIHSYEFFPFLHVLSLFVLHGQAQKNRTRKPFYRHYKGKRKRKKKFRTNMFSRRHSVAHGENKPLT